LRWRHLTVKNLINKRELLSLTMKNKDKKFDAVKLMRALREKINKEIANMTPEEIIEYFKQGSEQFEKEVAKRRTSTNNTLELQLSN